MKTIGIVGSRRRASQADFALCWTTFLNIYENGDSIVSGGCPIGGDAFEQLLTPMPNKRILVL